MTTPASGLIPFIRAGDVAGAMALLAQDPAQAAIRDEAGVSPLMWACYLRQGVLSEALRRMLSALDVFEAVAMDDEARVRELLAGDAKLTRAWSGDGFTALHFAAFFARPRLAEVLIAAGADVAAPSRNPMRVHALHSAAAARSLATCRVLLERGAPPDAAQHQGWTALMSAALHGDEALCDLLLAYGASTGTRSEDGRRAADMALEKNHQALAARLSPDTPV